MVSLASFRDRNFRSNVKPGFSLLFAKFEWYALRTSRMASSRTSYGTSCSHACACMAGESLLRSNARSSLMSNRTVWLRIAATAALYSQRTDPIHCRSVSLWSFVGYIFTLTALAAGGFFLSRFGRGFFFRAGSSGGGRNIVGETSGVGQRFTVAENQEFCIKLFHLPVPMLATVSEGHHDF